MFQSTGMHFISVTFVRTMLTCELNIRTQCRILENGNEGKQREEELKKKNGATLTTTSKEGKENSTSERTQMRWDIYLVPDGCILSACCESLRDNSVNQVQICTYFR